MMSNVFMQSNRQEHHNSITDFYYSNIYDDFSEIQKCKTMAYNVRTDTEPFLSYLRASKESLEKQTAVGSEVTLLEENKTILYPQFSLVKINTNSLYAEFEIPKGFYYYIECEDNDFESDNFEIFQGRSNKICNQDSKIDEYKGELFIKLENKIDENANYKLWHGEEKDWDIKLVPVDFSDADSYRLECENIDKSSVQFQNRKISFSLFSKSKDDECTVTLFDKTLPISVKLAENQTKIPNAINIGKNIFALPNSSNCKQFPSKNKIHYENIDVKNCVDEISNFISGNNISFSDGNFLYSGDSNKQNIKIEGLEFSVGKNKKQARTQKFNNCGFWIELKEDDSYKNEAFSNVDVFFNENVEYLTDEPQKNRFEQRRFYIGKTDRENSMMEICLFENKKPVRVKCPEKLFAVIDTNQIQKQISALITLRERPVREQKNLINLFDAKFGQYGEKIAKWTPVYSKEIDNWYMLTDTNYDGCENQREFVQKTLATNDFAFLNGPPGSGKTTTILEIIAQMISQGKKVLLAASTNAAVDNILERLEKLPEDLQEKIFAVRLGSRHSDSVDEFSRPENIDNDDWNEIVRRANVVCGTIIGILQHPDFKFDKSQCAFPIYDMLIIDEASKTTFQDFLIPSLFAKKWILSGDLKQLTPYVEQETIASSIEEIPAFSKQMQYVISVMMWSKLKDAENVLSKIKLTIPVSKETIKAAEILLPKESKKYRKNFAVLSKKKSDCPYSVSFEEFKNAGQKATLVYGADILFVDDEIFKEVLPMLPKNFFQFADESNYELSRKFIQDALYKDSRNKISIEKNYCDTLEDVYKKVNIHIKEKSFANEITWRLSRIHELQWSNEKQQIERYKEQINEIYAEHNKKEVKAHIDAITGIALPSVMQLLQQGMDEEVVKNKKETTLNKGFDKSDFEQRHTMLEYQHRMHSEISLYSRAKIYDGEALKDGSKLMKNRNWSYKGYPVHAVWLDVKGKNDCTNNNQAECNAIKNEVQKFIKWAEQTPHLKDSKKNWTIAILTYYTKQERMLKQTMQEIFGGKERSRYVADDKNIEVVIYTVDKFQGMEADIVFLSMVKSGSVNLGFMDSLNRFNVAITRAKYQRVVVGNNGYFSRCKSELLRNFAKNETNVSTFKPNNAM